MSSSLLSSSLITSLGAAFRAEDGAAARAAS
jgi:hypothetical protein